MSTPPNREVVLFSAALELEASQRGAYLDEACADDPALRLRLEALLRVHEEAIPFLEAPAPGTPGALIEVEAKDVTVCAAFIPSEKAGDRIGRYKLLQQIGEGGCGVVYMAEQEEPVRRRVALKVIKLGMDTRQVVARFEAERQALAMMDHPNIAKVLDAGATVMGRPFFVMELVKGIPITRYCDENHLGTEQRLRLFVQVCQAIQHAHQKGIIHRDIKPSNVLVADHDGVPVPKIIDFGIAKATTDQRLTDKTLFTAFEQFIGTPAYMSPEQAQLSGLDIDTRSDIYSLGVLLYELLTGSTPFDSKALMVAGLDEIRRTIREQEPERPSTRLSTMVAAELTEVAKLRRVEPAKLGSLIRGDLDWIVMKALEKDRARRYETANGLAADIQRHLNCEPVVARPHSRLYEFQKTVRRHKFGFTAAALVLVVLALGIAVSTWQAIRATRAERLQKGLWEQAVANEKKALQAQAETESQRQAAERARQGEAQQRKQAEQQRKQAEAAAYDSDINLAQQAVAMDNLGAAWSLLDRHRPKPSQDDLRGWEWRYLWQQCQSDALSGPCQVSSYIHSLAASADGRWLAVGGSFPESLSLLDVSNPRNPRKAGQLAADNGNIVVAFSPRAALLAFTSLTTDPGPRNNQNQVHPGDQFRIHLWNPELQKTVAELSLEGKCRGLAFAEDGQTLLTWKEGENGESRLGLWRVPSLEKLADYLTTPTPGAGWREFAATRNLALVAICFGEPGGSGRLHVIDLATGKQRWTVEVGITSTLAFAPDGQLLLSAEGFTAAPRVRFWDAISGGETGTGLTGHREAIFAMVFWPDGKTLATASADQTIRLWDLADPTHPQPLGRPLRGHKGEVWRLALLPDSQTLVSGGKDGSVLTWDTRQARIDRAHLTLRLPELETWRFAPDSKSIFTVDSSGQVAQWRGPDFQNRDGLIDIGAEFSSACFSEDGQFLASGSTNGLIQLWDLQRRARSMEFRAGSGVVRPQRFLAEGRKLIIEADESMLIHEWDLATRRETASWHDIAGYSMFSADERWHLTLGYGDGKFLARDMATGMLNVQTNRSLEIKELIQAAASPDGNLIAAASLRGFVRLFDRASLLDVGTLRGFLVEAVFSVCFSPDGKRLATGSGGREAIRLWDIERQQQLLLLEGDRFGNWGNTKMSPDGNLIGSVNGNSLNIWRAPSWAEIEAEETASTRAQ